MAAATAPQAVQLVVMGVSGCGKSSLGAALAHAASCHFVEGDSLHPPANVARMAAGIALTDDDRRDWLAAIGRLLADARRDRRSLVVSCSALKRRYRDGLRHACPGLRFVLLHGSATMLARRLQQRSDHYMPASLLDSQLATLEWPTPDERILVLPIEWAPDRQLDQTRHLLAL